MKIGHSFKEVSKKPINSPMLSGIIYAAIWLALGAITLSILLKWGSLREEQLLSSSLIVHGLAALAGGFVSGRRSGKKGWYYGGLLGLIYGLLVLLVGFLASNASFTSHTLTMIGAALTCGALGGMIGVNTKKN
ncbi:TIGR04086 family membrane protein [Paenibacillus sp. GCM10027626]|uniref:TIGR04086 family membrane protein n=1 Tax=Paenibacillus sp. GCM10027626 TaxID=3273411 RepID=UPI003639BF92